MAAKPFTPEEVQRILGSLQRPAVFLNMTCDWPVLHWTVDHLSHCLGQKTIRFRLGRKQETHAPLFETQCSYVEASLGQFLCWVRGQTGSGTGCLSDYPLPDYWAYADYKYIAMLFQDQPSMFKDVLWSEFGYPGRGGRESTLWIGTEGANTPCHQDSYGCNLVLQVQGRKRWHLFPPEDTDSLYPSRIPYEESSVFSLVDVLQPDLGRHPAFARARAHVVTLQPGQVLYVPRHWWHYVESLDPVTVSVNSWTELEVDDVARVGEALTKTVVCALKTTPSQDNHDDWLNPTEEEVPSHTENLQYLNLAVQACLERRGRSQRGDQQSQRGDQQSQRGDQQSQRGDQQSQRGDQQSQRGDQQSQRGDQQPGGTRAAKRDSSGQSRSSSGSSTSFTIPFGPHLIPVPSNQDHPQDAQGHGPRRREVTPSEDGVVGPSRVRGSTPHPDRGARHEAQCSSASHECRSPVREKGSGDPAEALGHALINTNDLLECLVHPDVISRVTELLLERQRHRNTIAS